MANSFYKDTDKALLLAQVFFCHQRPQKWSYSPGVESIGFIIFQYKEGAEVPTQRSETSPTVFFLEATSFLVETEKLPM